VGLVVLYLGISWLFRSGLRDFSPHLKLAYGLICAGYIVTGVGVAVAPMAKFSPDPGQGGLFYAQVVPAFIVSNILIYLGSRIFAQRLQVRSWLTSYWAVFGVTAAVAGASVWLPHARPEASEMMFDLHVAGSLTVALLAAASALLAYAVSRRTTQMYARAMRWLGATMTVVAMGGFTGAAIVYAVGEPQGAYLVLITGLFGVTGALMVASAYMFKRSSGST
jgi:hypothetical protein